MGSIERVRWTPGPTAVGALLTLGVLLGAVPSVAAQSVDGTGAVATGMLLRQLDGVKRVLMIAAHPDDEDTSLLTALARGQGAETAYLSLTRGGGGQNLIGPELWDGLGIVRTGELMAARRLDGGRQFFTRAFDYGYSKSADEALEFWQREELLRDVVWVVRTFRPHLIVTVWSGTAQDGHGQHQAAGIIARDAFAVAGDPDRFPDQLEDGVEAWTPLKLYQLSWRRFMPQVDDGSMDVPTGVYDPLLGRSLFQLSMESRSQHRSQDMGAAQPLGPRSSGVILEESLVEGEDQDLFAGIDTTLAGLAHGLPTERAQEAGEHLEAFRAAIGRAHRDFGLDPGLIAPALREARTHLDAARRAGGDDAGFEYRSALAAKAGVLDRAIMAASGVVFDVRADDDLVVPGQTVEVRAQLWNGGSSTVVGARVELDVPEGWKVRQVDGAQGAAGTVTAGTLSAWVYEVDIPARADPSRLYYLRQERQGATYRWPDDPALWGLARDPAAVSGSLSFGLRLDGDRSASEQPDPPRVSVSSPWRFVGVDPAFGQFEKPVLVVPAVSVSVEPSGVIWPQSRSGTRDITVVVRTEAEGGRNGSVTVTAPEGWGVRPASQNFELGEAGAERTLTFEASPLDGLSPGRQVFQVEATTDDGERFDEGYALVDYEHIERAALYSPAAATIAVAPLAVRDGLRVGYIMGSGDGGPEAIRQMGARVELLDEASVREGAFGDFSTIVLGVRAYETRPDLQAASGQLLDFARRGGTVVVQYNRGPLGSLAPYELQTGRGSPRVSDETAPVRVLEPSAPLFTTPNRIDDADFDGWVQERGLYFAGEWDERWVELLELSDPGEAPRHGALLAASVGDGVFVYSALSFFRQWAGQVPGAYRLFANLISLEPAEWRAFEQAR